MKRFIRYLYEYEKDKRIRNVGFIKVETGSEETIVHLQAKGFLDSDERKLVLYLFYVENGGVVGIRQDEMKLVSPVLGWNCIFTVDNVGGQEKYNKICGILIVTGSGRRIAATWDDRCVDVSNMREQGERGPEEGKSGLDTQESQPPAQAPTSQPQPEALAQAPTSQPQPESSAKAPTKQLTKISRQDISRLPRCEWHLANNQFLMHGFNNFHHLLLIDDGNYLKLGVPGIYHIKEAKYAEMYGFKEFLTSDELDKASELWEDDEFVGESEENEMFGYWCRPIRRPRYGR